MEIKRPTELKVRQDQVESEIEFYHDEEPIDSIIDDDLYSFSSRFLSSESESDELEKPVQIHAETNSLNEGFHTQQTKPEKLNENSGGRSKEILQVVKYQPYQSAFNLRKRDKKSA